MKNIHLIYNFKGGVYRILQLQNNNDNIILKSNLKGIFTLLLKYRGCNLYFHQPKSHIICLFLSLFKLNFKSLNCVLHESADFTSNITNNSRARIGFFIRKLIIRLCKKKSVNLFSVSNFVSSSYNINCKKISYLKLFIPLLEGYDCTNKTNSIVILLRKNNAYQSFLLTIALVNKFDIDNIYVFGEEDEVNIFKRSALSNNSINKIIDFDLSYFVSQEHFLQLLSTAKWFISHYEKEGFGLSIFQAMYFGCIIFCPRTGGFIDWLPTSNFNAASYAITGSLHSKDLKRFSNLNIAAAHQYIQSLI
jgi:hypothetical protein